MNVAVVILNWNGEKLFDRFIPAVIRHSDGVQIVIADNASTDDSVAKLKRDYPEITLICMAQNKGFAGGYNEALKQVEADIYVLLNSDVEVTPGWLIPPLQIMKDTNVAAVQPKVRSYEKRDYFEHAGACGGFIDRLGFPFCRGRIFEVVEKDEGQYDDTREVFWASGACMFVRRKSFDDAGGFSEAFFAHMEEIDLCWRFQRMGLRVLSCPTSVVYHLGGGTLNYMSPKKAFLNFRNSLYMLMRNESGWIGVKIAQRMILDGIAGIRFLFQGKPIFSWMVIKAHFQFYRRLPSLWKERKAIQNLGNHTAKGRYTRLIVFDHFLKGKHRFSKLNMD